MCVRASVSMCVCVCGACVRAFVRARIYACLCYVHRWSSARARAVRARCIGDDSFVGEFMSAAVEVFGESVLLQVSTSEHPSFPLVPIRTPHRSPVSTLSGHRAILARTTIQRTAHALRDNSLSLYLYLSISRSLSIDLSLYLCII